METIKILYFDDEKWLSETLQKNLMETYPQLQINRVDTIEKLLDELESANKYDLILLDIMAPMSMILDNVKIKKEFNSIEIQGMADGTNVGEILYQKIRKMVGYNTVPVLFYSAKRMTSIQGDNTAFLRKPEFAESLYNKIDSMIKKEL